MIAPVYWFTGLSGSGKTTISEGTKTRLEADDITVLIIDGDNIRTEFHGHLGFSEADIKTNNELISGLCESRRSEYDVILVPIISPYIASRKKARARLGSGFFEVYCNASLETVVKRDVKGLYAMASRDEIPDMIGYSPKSVYEPPENPDFVLDSGKASAEVSIEAFHKFVRRHLHTG